MIKNKQVKCNLKKPEDKIIDRDDNTIIDEMKPFIYFSQAKRLYEAKNRKYNKWSIWKEVWIYVGNNETKGFTKKELKEFKLINYVPKLATYNISLKKGVK